MHKQVMRTFGWTPTDEELKDMVNVIDQVNVRLMPGSCHRSGLRSASSLCVITLLGDSGFGERRSTSL